MFRPTQQCANQLPAATNRAAKQAKMLAATHFDNLLVLLFFAAAIVFQILTKAASKGRRRPPETRGRSTPPSQTARPLSTEQEETDQERIRKFLEALGQPTTSKPPPPVQPRPTYQRPVISPRVGPSLPPLITRPPDLPQESELPRKIILPQQIPPIRRAKTFRPTAPDAPFEVHRPSEALEIPQAITTSGEAYALVTKPPSTPTPAKSDFAALLRSRDGLREAIILREIFGPPRSMQPLELQSL